MATAFQPRTATSSLLAAIKECTLARDLESGRCIHDTAVESGAAENLFVSSSLVSMYARCGSMREAQRIFDGMPCRNAVSWTALIQGYVENNEELLALDSFEAMVRDGGCQPNGRTYVAVLRACSHLAVKEEAGDGELVKIKALEMVMAIHAGMQRTGCVVDVFVENALLDAYSRCGSLFDASKVFSGMVYRDVVSWTSLIRGFSENLQGEVALNLFERMLGEGCSLNPRTFLAAVKAIAALAAKEEPLALDGTMIKVMSLESGLALHALCLSRRFQDRYVTSSLIEMYAKCGSLADACRTFEEAGFLDDVVLWTTLILAHSNDVSGSEEQALGFYLRMRRHGCAPDARTYVALLKLGGKAVALRLVKAIHGELCRQGLDSGRTVANALVDAYGKCGSIHNAEKVFALLLSPDTVAHTSLMTGLCRQGEDGSGKVFKIFREMVDCGLRVDGITFLCLLTACSHAGLVDRGKRIFKAMQMPRYGVSPCIEHYHAMVDLLGRTNDLEAAMALVRTMPFEPTILTWTTMLAWCSKWKNASIGRLVFQRCLDLDSRNKTSYQLMANL